MREAPKILKHAAQVIREYAASATQAEKIAGEQQTQYYIDLDELKEKVNDGSKT